MEKTVKLRAYTDAGIAAEAQNKPAEDRSKSQEYAKLNSLLEEERSKSLENLKTIVQLRESLKQEQARAVEAGRKAAELEAKLREHALLEANELARKNAQIEEEKKKTLEHQKTIDQLREMLKQEQAKSAGATDKTAELEAMSKELAMLEAKVKDMSGVLNKIASIAEAGKLLGNA
ncbi:MAG: hypothetical protein HZB95_01900 [Nitrosomonadales bacterium]|nr:hypothetical protein [Nitrosomonadales bacterium]